MAMTSDDGNQVSDCAKFPYVMMVISLFVTFERFWVFLSAGHEEEESSFILGLLGVSQVAFGQRIPLLFFCMFVPYYTRSP